MIEDEIRHYDQVKSIPLIFTRPRGDQRLHRLAPDVALHSNSVAHHLGHVLLNVIA